MTANKYYRIKIAPEGKLRTHYITDVTIDGGVVSGRRVTRSGDFIGQSANVDNIDVFVGVRSIDEVVFNPKYGNLEVLV